ncbi:hypothetical protein TNIN_123721 [Trichonephila inaurata madagascariensis]|uniref:Uncharacterized protein n=1 Tax=Trichonephila inaurata madagascariensis TaxID=2747483 RepID=A0A8X7CDT7_9ARAC|nr:hypothetical protein TNIN_123721 [Trichonephila inaurata madagascariensis]
MSIPYSRCSKLSSQMYHLASSENPWNVGFLIICKSTQQSLCKTSFFRFPCLVYVSETGFIKLISVRLPGTCIIRFDTARSVYRQTGVFKPVIDVLGTAAEEVEQKIA